MAPPTFTRAHLLTVIDGKTHIDNVRLMRPAGSDKVTATSIHLDGLSVLLDPDMHPAEAASSLRILAAGLEQRLAELLHKPDGAA